VTSECSQGLTLTNLRGFSGAFQVCLFLL